MGCLVLVGCSPSSVFSSDLEQMKNYTKKTTLKYNSEYSGLYTYVEISTEDVLLERLPHVALGAIFGKASSFGGFWADPPI